MEASQESSDGQVSIFFFCDSKYKGSVKMNYLLVDECLYSTHKTVTSF